MRVLLPVAPHARAHLLGALALSVAAAAPVRGQDPVPPARQAPPAACAASEHRQFDFWIGEWDVVNAQGAAAGRNRITSEFGGCVLREQWTGVNGPAGSSFNIFDARTRRWHQTWVDGGGTLLLLDGGLREDGAMVLEGERPGPQGGTVRDRITWTPLSDGAVRQLWEASSDDGGTWRVIFDGRYRRTGPASKLDVSLIRTCSCPRHVPVRTGGRAEDGFAAPGTDAPPAILA